MFVGCRFVVEEYANGWAVVVIKLSLVGAPDKCDQEYNGNDHTNSD